MKTALSILVPFLIAGTLAAETIQIADTGITFEAPEGLKPLSAEIMAIKWPSTRAPAFAVGNESAATTIAYDLKPHQIPQDKLPEVQQAFTQMFDRMIPGIAWKKNEIIELSGQKWLFLEMTSNAADADIHNIVLATGFQDRMLVFNFNSTKDEFPKYENALRQSIQSIKLPKP